MYSVHFKGDFESLGEEEDERDKECVRASLTREQIILLWIVVLRIAQFPCVSLDYKLVQYSSTPIPESYGSCICIRIRVCILSVYSEQGLNCFSVHSFLHEHMSLLCIRYTESSKIYLLSHLFSFLLQLLKIFFPSKGEISFL